MKKIYLTIAFALLLISAGAQTIQFPDSLKNAWSKIYNLTEEDDLNKCIKAKAKKCEENVFCYLYCVLNLPFCLAKWTAECYLYK